MRPENTLWLVVSFVVLCLALLSWREMGRTGKLLTAAYLVLMAAWILLTELNILQPGGPS